MQRLFIYFVTALVLVTVAWGSACISASPIRGALQGAGLGDQTVLGRLSEGLEYLVAPSALPLPDLNAAAATGTWQDNDKPTLNLGYQPDGAWVRFTVANGSQQPVQRLLMVDWGYERIEAWVFDKAAGKWSAPVSSGTSVAASKRSLVSPLLVLPLQFPPGEAQVYLRLETNQAMVLPMRLVDPAALEEEERGESLRMGAFFGAMLMMLLYNASLFIFTRDRSYLYYCGYLAAAAFYVASTYNYGPFFIWADWQWLPSRANVLSLSLGFLAVAVFSRQFLDLRREGGWLLRLNSAGIVYWAVASLVSALAPKAINYLFIDDVGALACVSLLAIAIIVWRRGNVTGGYFVIAWSALLVSTLCITLAVAGFLPMSAYMRSAQLIGFVLEFLLLSIALAERINREKASRLQAQEALLSIQEKANQLLEERVALRTQELEHANRELLLLSSTDPLTGLNNRRGFEKRLQAVIERSRAEGVHLAFLMIDIDYFKRINDRHGHSFGDECLALLGQTLAKFSRRESEFAARLGGEEFASVLYGIHANNALAVAEQIRAAVAELAVTDSVQTVRFTVSIGLAAWIPDSGDSPMVFAKAADEALYLAKAQGRNQVCLAPRR